VIQVSFGARELFGIACNQSDLSSTRANLPGDFQAKAAGAAGDEGDFVVI
jgi:hypothetical protein